MNPTPPTAAPRVFLVVVDESEELRNALRYACRRAQRTNGHVALLHVIEPVEFQHWLGVGRVLEEDARAQAELKLQKLASLQTNDVHIYAKQDLPLKFKADVGNLGEIVVYVKSEEDIRREEEEDEDEDEDQSDEEDSEQEEGI